MELLVMALTAQRWVTTAVGSATLFGGTVAWGPLAGLWLTVWVVGLLCVGLGATMHEIVLRHQRSGLGEPIPEGRARRVKLSGFGYLSVGMVAGWFAPILAMTVLSVALVDYVAGHRVAQRLAA